MMKLIQVTALVLLVASSACSNSTRESTGTRDTDGRGGSHTRAADPSPSPVSH